MWGRAHSPVQQAQRATSTPPSPESQEGGAGLSGLRVADRILNPALAPEVSVSPQTRISRVHTAGPNQTAPLPLPS